MSVMGKDPVVEEVRKHRQEHAAKFGFEIRAIGEDARKREKASGHRVVKPPRRQRDSA